MPTLMNTIDMACHTWALSGNPIAAAGINQVYQSLSNTRGAYYGFGDNLRGQTLAEIRQETMDKIALLCEVREHKTHHVVYLCGGFSNGQVCPEHLWLEDHTATRTYDTFINQEVRTVNRVGVVGQAFQPGCEAQPFLANDIRRVQVNGYTRDQVVVTN